MANIVSHGACGVKWTQIGNQTGHCSGCHETFSSGYGFDQHQSVVEGRSVCKHPTEMKPVLVSRPDRNTGVNVWGEPSSTRNPRGAVTGPPALVTSTTPGASQRSLDALTSAPRVPSPVQGADNSATNKENDK